MPPDHTKAPSTRRAQRKFTEEELKDIELKRIRGELSCAECRRLKLRCDKKVPCSSCSRRGCDSICPCGILSAGQGTRFILADTDKLHKKIAQMSHRIRQLEDALAILQSTVSDQRHPLLEDDLLKVKFGPEVTDKQHSSLPPEADQTMSQSIDALGTLTLGDSGEVKYFGRSAGSETLMLATEDSDEQEDEEMTAFSLNPEIETIANLFPFTKRKHSDSATLALLESHLPSQERALSLCESYLKHASNFFRPIKRDELLESFMPDIYKTAATRSKETNDDNHSAPSISEPPREVPTNTPHALATLYFLFALGALLDLDLPPYNAEAEHYYELARVALSLRVIFDSPQLDTVQALGLMATYHTLAGKKYSRESAWCVMSFAAKLAQAIGLHRDSARWKMDAKTVQKRRMLFWEVFSADVSHSLALGRPPAMHLSYVDCEFPIDEEATLSDDGQLQNGFWRMKYSFGRDMFLAVADSTLVAKSPSYAKVLEIDHKVREISFPTSFKPYVSREDGEDVYYSSSLSLQGFYASQHRTVTMIYLHRSFFAQAMLDHPSNPLLSPFAPSFLTAYRCASIIIKASAHQFDRCDRMAVRVWFLMYHVFSAAVIVGTVVTRSPNSEVSPSALQDLTQAVELFEKTAAVSQRARIALGVLRKLKAKAIVAYTQYTSAKGSPQIYASHRNLFPLSSEQQAIDDGDDELAIFGGQTRVLARRSRNKRHGASAGNRSSLSPSGSSPSSTDETVLQSKDTPLTVMPGSTGDSLSAAVNILGSASLHATTSSPSVSVSNGDGTQRLTSSIANPIFPSDPPPTQLETYLPPTSAKQMDNMISSFTGYLASRTSNRPATNSSNPYSYIQPSQTERHTEWREASPDVNGLPKADTSFGWLPPSQLPGVQRQRPSSVETMPLAPGPFIDVGQLMEHPSMSAQQPAYASAPSYQGEYNVPPATTMQDPNMVTDPEGTLYELGLMRGSDVDSGWLSFIQDCGIMEADIDSSLSGSR